MASEITLDTLESKSGNAISFSGKILDFSNSDGYFSIPVGTTAQRGNAIEGAIRWNTDINYLEIYDGTRWKQLRILKVNEIIEQNGLQMSLDSNNLNSYPGFERKWYDETVSNNFTCYLQNSPTFTQDATYGGLLDFNGTNQYGTIELSEKLQPTGAITQEVWFRTDSTSGTQVFIGHQYGISSNNSYAIWITNSEWRGGVNLDGTWTEFQIPFSTVPISTNTWYQFVHSYNSNNFTKTFSGRVTTLSNVITDCVGLDIDIQVGYEITGSGMQAGTTITNIDIANAEVTVSQAATLDNPEGSFSTSIPPSQYMFVNGNLIGIQANTGSITYTAENTQLVIGADWGGAGANTGPGAFVDGELPIARIYSSFLPPTSVKSNFEIIRSRFGL